MYTHCRQFPHLQGRNDDEIRAIIRYSLDKRPAYRFAMRARNVVVLATLVGVFAAYLDAPPPQLGRALILAGVIATAVVLAWNVLWVNLVLFKLTEQATRGESS